MHDHRRHQAAQGFHKFAACPEFVLWQHCRQMLDGVAVAVDRGRVKRHDLVAAVQCPELRLQRLALGLQGIERRDQWRPGRAALEQLDHALVLTVNLADAALQLLPGAAGRAGQLAALVVVRADVFRQCDRVHQFALQTAQRQALDVLPLHLATVATDATLAVVRTLQPGGPVPLSHRHHAAAAGAAAEQAGQEATGLAAAGPMACRGRFAALCGLPDVVGDDAKMRRLGGAMLGLWVGARDALAGRRILHHPDLVPDDAAGIDLVKQDTRAALQVAVDGRGVPDVAARRRDAGRIQRARDVARRFAGDVIREDAAHDVGFGVDDRQLAGLARHGAVAIGAAAGMAAGAHHAVHAAADVHHQVLEKHLTHQRAQRAVELADLAGGGVDGDAEKIQPLARGVPVALISRDAVDVLGHHDVEGACLGGAHHRDEARPVQRRAAGDRAVLEGRHHGHALAAADLAAQRDLVVDRTIVLQVGGEAGVNGGANHERCVPDAAAVMAVNLLCRLPGLAGMILAGMLFGKRADGGQQLVRQLMLRSWLGRAGHQARTVRRQRRSPISPPATTSPE